MFVLLLACTLNCIVVIYDFDVTIDTLAHGLTPKIEFNINLHDQLCKAYTVVECGMTSLPMHHKWIETTPIIYKLITFIYGGRVSTE